MKRTELLRRTPLARGTKPLRNRTELARGGPLNPVSAKRAKDNAVRTKVVNGLRLAQLGRCPRCRRGDSPIYGHELRRRSQGGSIVNPQVAVCNACNSAIAQSPRVSTWNGWDTNVKWPTDPMLEPGTARDLYGNIVAFGLPDEAIA